MSVKFAEFVCLEPKLIRGHLLQQRIGVERWFGRPNYYHTSLGLESGSSWILLTERSIQKLISERRIDRYHDLVFQHRQKITIKDLVIKSWRRLYPASAKDQTAACLVELVDCRALLKRIPVNKRYNLRDSSGVRIAATQNGGSDWTWAEMVEDLWNLVPDLGSFPGMPFTPDGVPEGFVFDGMTAFESLSHVFTRLSVGVFYSPTAASFDLVQLGTSLSIAQKKIDGWVNAGLRIWDDFPGESTIAKLPEQVRVCHWKLPVPSDGTSLVYTQDVSGGLASDQVQAGSVAILWDDLPAIYSGSTLTNSAALSTRATERKNDYYRVAQKLVPRLQVFAGVDPLSRLALWGGSAMQLAIGDRGAGYRWELFNSGNEEMKLEAWRPYRQFYSAAGGTDPGCTETEEVLDKICFSKTDGVVTGGKIRYKTIDKCTGAIVSTRCEDIEDCDTSFCPNPSAKDVTSTCLEEVIGITLPMYRTMYLKFVEVTVGTTNSFDNVNLQINYLDGTDCWYGGQCITIDGNGLTYNTAFSVCCSPDGGFVMDINTLDLPPGNGFPYECGDNPADAIADFARRVEFESYTLISGDPFIAEFIISVGTEALSGEGTDFLFGGAGGARIKFRVQDQPF